MAGNNPIGFSDLFNFNDRDQILQAIKDIRQLKNTYKDFLNDVAGAQLADLTKQQAELAKTLRDVSTATKSLSVTNEKHQQIIIKNLETIQQLREENRKLREAKQGVKQIEDSLAGSVDALTKQLKDQIKEWRAMDREADPQKFKELSENIKKTKAEISQLTNATKANVVQFKAAKGSYDALDQRTKELVRTLKAMEGGMSNNSREAQRLKKEIHANTTELKKFDSEMNHNFRNVGNYKSAFGGLNNALSTVGMTTLSLGALFTGLGAIIDEASRFENLEAGIRGVVDSEEEFADIMQFLSTIADTYGQDLTVLTNTYKGLAAAAKGTSMEGAETKRLFEGIIKAGSALKLTNEQVEGSLLAIQQMMSKGTVSAEELRGQLGERLPIANKVFAQALGVSEAEMAKMLQRGEVLANDVLPKVSRILNETYSEKAIANAQGLTNETNRLSNAWTRFADAFSDTTGLMKFWAGFKGLLANMMDSITGFLESPSFKTFMGIGNGQNAMMAEIKKNQANREQAFRMASPEDRARSMAQVRDKADANVAMLNDPSATDRERKNAARNLRAHTEELRKMVAINDELAKQEVKIEQRRTTETKAAQDAQTKNRKAHAKTAEQVEKERLAALEKSIRKADELSRANTDYALAAEGLRHAKAGPSMGEDIRHEEEKLRIIRAGFDERMRLYSKDSTEYLKLATDKIEAEERAVKAIQDIKDDAEKGEKRRHEDAMRRAREVRQAQAEMDDARQDITDAIIGGNIQKEMASGKMDESEGKDQLYAMRQARLQDEINQRKEAMKEMEMNSQEWLDTQKQMMDIEKRMVDDRIDHEIRKEEELKGKRMMLRQAVIDFAFEAGNAVFEFMTQNLDAEADALERNKDRELEVAGNNAQARRRIEENYQKESARIRRKQAVADKAQALFNIALNTAVGVSNAMSKVATIPLVPFIVAGGLVQAALVLSKPLPAYATGRGKGKDEIARINERGWEFIENNGRLRVEGAGKETVTHLHKEDIVHTHETSKKMLEGIQDKKERDQYMDSLLEGTGVVRRVENEKFKLLASSVSRSALKKEDMEDAFLSVMKRLPINNFVADEKGYRSFVTKMSARVENLNKRNNLFGNG